MEYEFEEMVERGLGELYSAALFMSGGVERLAEDRVVAAIAEAATHWLSPSEAGGLSWLEERLVVLCVERDAEERTSRPAATTSSVSALEPPALLKVDRDRFYRAAAALPPASRAAVWLGMFRRRPYADVAALLGVSLDELRELPATGSNWCSLRPGRTPRARHRMRLGDLRRAAGPASLRRSR